MGKISRMEHKGWRRRHRIDLIDRRLQRSCYIRIGRLIETDMTVADLNETEIRCRHHQPLPEPARRPVEQLAHPVGLHNAARHHPEDPRPRPGHTLEETPSVYAIIVGLWIR